MTEAALYLADEVYFCVTQGHGVFLDLKRDKYSAILFEAGEHRTHDRTASSLAAWLAGQREVLLEAGLVTTNPSGARPLDAKVGEPIEGHIFGLDDQRAFGLTGEAAAGLNISIAETLNFFLASWRASYLLKHRHIAPIVIGVRRRKQRAGDVKTDPEMLRRLTAVFRRLRPWYPRKYLCLYDSLALIEFLAKYKIYPLWIFAVQAQPFGAHCWVQNDRLLLNEGREYAGQFTPIMAV